MIISILNEEKGYDEKSRDIASIAYGLEYVEIYIGDFRIRILHSELDEINSNIIKFKYQM